LELGAVDRLGADQRGRLRAAHRRPLPQTGRLRPTFCAPPCPAPGRWPGDPYDIADPQETPVPNTAAEQPLTEPPRTDQDRAAHQNALVRGGWTRTPPSSS
ncbi:hypothetical protein ABZ641_36725, partial [Kitasatospora sp. NPDC007106]